MAHLLKSMARVSGAANLGDSLEWKAITSWMQRVGGRNFKGELDRRERSLADICKEINDTRISQKRSAREVATNEAVKALATEEGQEVLAHAVEAGVSSVMAAAKAKGKGAFSSMSAALEGTSSRFFGRKEEESKSSEEGPTNDNGHAFSSLITRKQALIRRNRRGNPILRQKA